MEEETDPLAIDSAEFLASGNSNIEFVIEGDEDETPVTIDRLQEVLKSNSWHNTDDDIIICVEEESIHNTMDDSETDCAHESLIDLQNEVRGRKKRGNKAKKPANHNISKKTPQCTKIANEKSKKVPTETKESIKPSFNFSQYPDFHDDEDDDNIICVEDENKHNTMDDSETDCAHESLIDLQNEVRGRKKRGNKAKKPANHNISKKTPQCTKIANEKSKKVPTETKESIKPSFNFSQYPDFHDDEDDDNIICVKDENKHNTMDDSETDCAHESLIDLQNEVRGRKKRGNKAKKSANHNISKKIPQCTKIVNEKSKKVPTETKESIKPSFNFPQYPDFHDDEDDNIICVEDENEHNTMDDSETDCAYASLIDLQNEVQGKQKGENKSKTSASHNISKKTPQSVKVGNEKSKKVPAATKEPVEPSSNISQKHDFHESFLSFVDSEIQKTMVRQSNFEKFMNDSARKTKSVLAKSISPNIDEPDNLLPAKRLRISPEKEPLKRTLAVKPITTMLPAPIPISIPQKNNPARILLKSRLEIKRRKSKVAQTIIPGIQKQNIVENNPNVLYIMGPDNGIKILGNRHVAVPVGMLPTKGNPIALSGGILPAQCNAIVLPSGLSAEVPMSILPLPGQSQATPNTTFILASSIQSGQMIANPVNPALSPSENSSPVVSALPVISNVQSISSVTKDKSVTLKSNPFALPIITDVRTVQQTASMFTSISRNPKSLLKKMDLKVLSKIVKEVKSDTSDKANSSTKPLKMIIEGEEIEIVEPDSLNDSQKAPKTASLEKDSSEVFTEVHEEEVNICYVPKCTIQKGEKVYLFGVPLDRTLLNIWDVSIGRTNKKLESTDVVCEKHFSPEDIVFIKDMKDPNAEAKLKLKKGAIPCLSYFKNCCVPNCNNDKGRMYKFPILNPPNLQLWLYLIKDPKLRNVSVTGLLKHRICHRHFDKSCFNRHGDLDKVAAPTLNMPESTVSDSTVEKSTPKFQGVTWSAYLKCLFPECDRPKGSSNRVYVFPRHFDKCKDWLKACQRSDLIKDTLHGTYQQIETLGVGVCQEHFGLTDYDGPTTDRLKFTAVPKDMNNLANRLVKSVHQETTIDLTISDSPENSNDTQTFDKSSPRCVYLNCSAKKGADVQLFSFPKDRARFKIWLETCGYRGIKDIVNDNRLKVCSKHFIPSMFIEGKNNIRTLMANAVPVYSFETIKCTLKSKKNKLLFLIGDVLLPCKERLFCAVTTCSNIYSKENLKCQDHRFPDPEEDAERFEIWMKLIGNEALNDVLKQAIRETYIVCEMHFESFFYKNGPKKTGALSFCAVPTMHLTRDHKWLFKTDYYKNIIVEYVKSVITASETASENSTSHCMDLKIINNIKPENTCELSKNRLNDPGLGFSIHMASSDPVSKKQSYDLYKYQGDGRSCYSLVEDFNCSQTLQAHSAVVIEDDDKVVLQEVLDKKRQFIKSSTKCVDVEI